MFPDDPRSNFGSVSPAGTHRIRPNPPNQEWLILKSTMRVYKKFTLVVSLSKRDHTRSVMAAEYLIALVDASKARSLGLGSTTP